MKNEKLVDYRQKLNSTTNSMTDLKYNWFNIFRNKSEWQNTDFRGADGMKHVRKTLVMNIPKLITSRINSLIFSEEPTYNCSKEIQDILKYNNINENLKKWNEYVNALGGGVLKLYNQDGRTMIDFVKAQNFKPISWNNSGIFEADFFTDITLREKPATIIEQHRKAFNIVDGYNIHREIIDENGETLPITTFDDNEVPDVFIPTKTPLFVYVGSIANNNMSAESPENISIFANALDAIKATEISFDMNTNELILGKKRIIVPVNALQKVLNPDTNKLQWYFDVNDEIFSGLNLEEGESSKIVDNSGVLRIPEIVSALNVNLKAVSSIIGLDANFLSLDATSGVMATATQIISEESQTFRTIGEMKNTLSRGLEKLIHIIASYEGLPDEEVSVKFADNIQETRTEKTAYWTGRYVAGTTTLVEVLMKLDGLTHDQAVKKAEEIKLEKKEALTVVPDMFSSEGE